MNQLLFDQLIINAVSPIHLCFTVNNKIRKTNSNNEISFFILQIMNGTKYNFWKKL